MLEAVFIIALIVFAHRLRRAARPPQTVLLEIPITSIISLTAGGAKHRGGLNPEDGLGGGTSHTLGYPVRRAALDPLRPFAPQFGTGLDAARPSHQPLTQLDLCNLGA